MNDRGLRTALLILVVVVIVILLLIIFGELPADAGSTWSGTLPRLT